MNTGPGHSSAHGPSSLPNWWPADPRHTSTSTSDVMSQLCRVCGEPAAGFHFGAFTCEGCKSFFGRTYNNLSSISECKNNSECVINKKNRTSCKACRLRKCLVVGMSKSGSRYGRRSNWFKIHCLLQEQQQHHHQQQNQQHQHQPQQQHLQNPQNAQNPQHQLTGVSSGLQHFQHQLHQQSLQANRPSLRDPGQTPPTPPPWADVKHHLRLDADNNNSVAGDLNIKQDVGGGGGGGSGGRLSMSAAAAAAAAAVVQAVRPELLRWPSPFFPAFPFPPPAPFFLALQPPSAAPLHRPRSSSSPASRSSCTAFDDHDVDEDDDDGDGQPAPKRPVLAVGRDLPPVQESPMDLSVSAAALPPSRPPPPSSLSRSPSPADGAGRADGRSPGTRSSAHHHPSRQSRHRRRRRRLLGRDLVDRTSGSDTRDGSSSSDSFGSADATAVNDERLAKNVPLDLTCNRS